MNQGSTLFWAAVGALALLGCSKDKSSSGCTSCPEGQICVNGECSDPGTALLTAELGSAEGQFGVVDAEEAESIAPSALAVTPDGSRLYMLDQENTRIYRFEGAKRTSTIRIDTNGARDVEVLAGVKAADDLLVLLDPRADELVVLDAEGTRRSSAPITGTGVGSAGEIRTLYAREDGIWMRADGPVIRVLDADGEAVENRRSLPGLLSVDGERLLSVSVLGDGSVNVVNRESRGPATYRHKQLRFEVPLLFVQMWDFDAEGNLYLFTQHEGEGADGFEAYGLLTVLSSELEEIRQVRLVGQETLRSVKNPFAVSAKGEVFQIQTQDDAISVRRY